MHFIPNPRDYHTRQYIPSPLICVRLADRILRPRKCSNPGLSIDHLRKPVFIIVIIELSSVCGVVVVLKAYEFHR